MELEKTQVIANKILSVLTPYCEKIEIAGSIRRQRSFPHDIDIVAIPSNQGQFVYQLQQMGLIEMGGQKLIRVELQLGYLPGTMLDVYVATPETWATLLLIRTGSKEHNIYLCTRARQKGMKLHADGSGLFRALERVAGDTEESIFKTLGLDYVIPERRER